LWCRESELAAARGRYKSNCDGMRMVSKLLNFVKPVLAIPIWLVVVMAIIAAIIGGPIAVFLWALIAMCGISWARFFVLAKMMTALAFFGASSKGCPRRHRKLGLIVGNSVASYPFPLATLDSANQSRY
jgi:hypothetical protein